MTQKDRCNRAYSFAFRSFQALIFAVLVLLMSFPVAAKNTLVLGVFSYRPLPVMQERFEPLIQHINSQLETTNIELQILSKSELEKALITNQLDLLLTNPSHYIHLQHHYELHGVLATLVNRERDVPVSQLGGVILATQTSGIQTLSDLKGREVAIPGRRFLGGFQTQAYELLQQAQLKIDQDIIVKEVGSHDAVIEALVQGQSEVGFVRSGIIEQVFDSNKPLPAGLRVINAQEFAGYPFAVSTRLYPEWPLVTVNPCPCDREILKAFINLDPDHPVMNKLAIDGFAPPANYSSLDQLAQTLRLPPYDLSNSLIDQLLDEYRWYLLLGSTLLFLILAFTLQQYRSNKRLRITLKQLKQQEQATLRAKQALNEKAELLKQSNNELEQFAYVASHDLRQPLRMITSYLRLLEQRLADHLDDETKRYFHFAIDGAQRKDEMLKALLDYSRVGQVGEPTKRLNSKKHLLEAIAFLNPEIKKTQAEIRVSDDHWPEIKASANELTRLFLNLIGNAIKYHQPNQAPKVAVAVQAIEGFWLFSIKDQGIGISPDQLDRVFNVFQRLHTREQFEGTGIGLAICKKIVLRHGGQIWVESGGIHQGSCFYFTLPRSDH